MADNDKALETNIVAHSDTDQPCKQLPVSAWSGQEPSAGIDWIAQECAVALVYNGVSHAVMMATPTELEAFALGFSLTEGIIDSADDIYDIQICTHETPSSAGIEVAISISSECFMRLKTRRRNLVGRTGCGICGAQSLEQVRSSLDPVEVNFTISHGAINAASRALNEHQPLQELTGAVHGAAWCSSDGQIVQVCEDVGRHNALDKLIGRLWNNPCLQQPGFLLMSSRASYEILQKAARAQLGIVVAVSAPTSLAIEVAQEAQLTLVGFSREGRHVTYTHGERIQE